MNRRRATLFASIAYALIVRLMVRRTDRQIVRLVRRVRRLATWLGRTSNELVVLDDAIAIFCMGPEATNIARRFIVEADPAQVKAVVRGALWD